MVEVPTSALNVRKAKNKGRAKMNKVGLYIHIPFCRRKCPYCDFYSISFNEELKAKYLKVLEQEIFNFSKKMQGLEADSLYLGGGTPSLLDAFEVEGIINKCQKNFALSYESEVTLEANPDTLNLEKLKGYRSAGINRLSLGFQSFKDEELKLIGRLHTVQKALKIYEQALKANFKNISIDLIMGLPQQSKERWEFSLKQVAQLKPQHISAYILEIKGNSSWAKNPPAFLPSEELVEEMYYMTIDYLTSQDYRHYEISNFALQGFSSHHNLKYWNGGYYLGLGCAAHSFYGNYRYNNVTDINQYIKFIEHSGSAIENEVVVTPQKRLEETIFLGLRKTEGIEVKRFKQQYGIDIITYFSTEINRFIEAGLIEINNGFLKLTRKGLLLSNEVFQAFLLE